MSWLWVLFRVAMGEDDATQLVVPAPDKGPMQASRSVAPLSWTRYVGQSWRREAAGLPDVMTRLLSVALGEELRPLTGGRRPRGPELVERRDRAIAVAAFLEGCPPQWLARRAANPKRTEAFAVAAACAASAAEEDPEGLRRARRAFRQIRDDFQDGTMAGLLGMRGNGRGPVYQQARRRARAARAEGETWANVSTLRAQVARLAGRRDALAGAVDDARHVADAGYRLGAREGRFVRSTVPAVDVARELASMRANWSTMAPSCAPSPPPAA